MADGGVFPLRGLPHAGESAGGAWFPGAAGNAVYVEQPGPAQVRHGKKGALGNGGQGVASLVAKGGRPPGAAIHEFALGKGYQVVREIGGHGVGLEFHEDPFVSYVTRRDTGMLLVPGMVFTIEPMINLGTDEIFIDEENDWTVYTEDGAPSAQWEVTVAVTEDGYEILAY